MTRVLGLDLSITATGIACPDGTTHTVKTRDRDGDRRLLYIAAAIAEALTGGVDLAVIEDLPVHAKAGGITGMVQGVARHLLLTRDVPYALIPPSSLKAFAAGNGTASKSQMAVAAYQRAQAEFGDDNQCDAWWCRMAGLVRLGAAPITLPAAQINRLAPVAWPEALITELQGGTDRG